MLIRALYNTPIDPNIPAPAATFEALLGVLGLLDFEVKIKGLLDYLPPNLRIMDSLKIKGL